MCRNEAQAHSNAGFSILAPVGVVMTRLGRNHLSEPHVVTSERKQIMVHRRFVLLLVLLSLLTFPAALPTHVQAGCTTEGCDPGGTSCEADAQTVPGATAYVTDGYIELRYSPSCGMEWARGSTRVWTSNGYIYPSRTIDVWLEKQGSSTHIYEESGYSYRRWTRMLHDPDPPNNVKYRACGWINNSSNWNCTAYYD